MNRLADPPPTTVYQKPNMALLSELAAKREGTPTLGRKFEILLIPGSDPVPATGCRWARGLLPMFHVDGV